MELKDFEREIAAIKHCAKDLGCDSCPYHNDTTGCGTLRVKTAELIDFLMSPPPTACDYEAIAQSHSEEIKKLHDKLSKAETVHERTQHELREARKELIALRAVRDTVEAFLGRKING